MLRCVLAGTSLKKWGDTIHIFGTSEGPETMTSISEDECKDTECSQESVLARRNREHMVSCWLSKPARDYEDSIRIE